MTGSAAEWHLSTALGRTHAVYRGDLYTTAGVSGGKARTCWAIGQAAAAAGCTGLVTAGSRQSPQVNIVAQVARHLGLASMAYVPHGPLGPELELAVQAGCQVVPTRPGYNSVITARARLWAEQHPEWGHVPFGMECAEALSSADHGISTMPEHAGISSEAGRLVVPVGSGMTLAAIMHALSRWQLTLPIRAVLVGADPAKRLQQWAPVLWQAQHDVEFVHSGYDYHTHAPPELVHALGYPLDPVYEAKCVPHLHPGDSLWIVGVRQTHQQEVQQ